MRRIFVFGMILVLAVGVIGGGALFLLRGRGIESLQIGQEDKTDSLFGVLEPAGETDREIVPAPNPEADDDGDGLSNQDELLWGTDAANPDTDGDGYLDGEEVAANHDPTKPAPDDELTEDSPAAPPTSLSTQLSFSQLDQYFVDDLNLSLGSGNFTDEYERVTDPVDRSRAQFDISENTIRWANGLGTRDTIGIGDHLTILPTTGVLHTVADGDTISAIAQAYDVASNKIIEYNGLDDDGSKLSIGQKVIVPGGYIAPSTGRRFASGDTTTVGGTPPPNASVSGSGFAWPTITRHISQYFRWGHTGIDIDNRSRPSIYAVAAGTVEFTGRLGGYGNLIIINHGNGVQTYYGHNEKHYVAKGTKVTKGQAIAKMGSTGRSTGPHVHFEVRKQGRPVNPLSMY